MNLVFFYFYFKFVKIFSSFSHSFFQVHFVSAYKAQNIKS